MSITEKAARLKMLEQVDEIVARTSSPLSQMRDKIVIVLALAGIKAINYWLNEFLN